MSGDERYDVGSDRDIDDVDAIEDEALVDDNDVDKRANHSLSERIRRDRIKRCFNSLRESIPVFKDKRSASKVQILTQAAEYIQYQVNKNNNIKAEVEDLEKENKALQECVNKATEAFICGDIETANSVLASPIVLKHRTSSLDSVDSESDTPDHLTSDYSPPSRKRLRAH